MAGAAQPGAPTFLPLVVSGSITNVHSSGSNAQATYTISSAGCGASCWTYAHAFQVSTSESCAWGDGRHKWIFKGGAHPVPFVERAAAVAFAKAYTSVRLCLYVEASIQSARSQRFLAEAVANQTSSGTPLTVANICSFNSGFGERKEYGPLVYWDYNHDGQPDFGAFNFEGDSAVDLAFVVRAGRVAWVALCYPHESKWVNVEGYEQEQHQELQLGASTSGWIAFSNLLEGNANIAAPWVDPTPYVGQVFRNGSGGSCDLNYDFCIQVQ